jgi:hypothetical protein
MTVYLAWWGLAAGGLLLGAIAIFRMGRFRKRVFKRSVGVLDARQVPLVVYRSAWVLRSGKGQRGKAQRDKR